LGAGGGTERLVDPAGKSYYQSADIDVVGISSVDKMMVAGECKFKNEKMGEDVYDTLIRRSKAVAGTYRLGAILLFSLSGFSEQFRMLKDDTVRFYTLEDIYHVKRTAIITSSTQNEDDHV